MSDTPEIPVPIGRISELAQLRTPHEWDLDFVRGDSLQIVFRLFREVDCCDGSSAQTLTGFSGRARIRKAVDYPAYTDLTVSVDTTAGSGRVTVSATPSQTALLYDFGVWELQIYNAGETIAKTIVQGSVNCVRDLIQ